VQFHGLPAAIDTHHHTEPAGPPCLNARDRVLDDDRACRFDVEAPNGLQEHVGSRFPLQPQSSEIQPVHAHIEECRYPGGVEHCGAVPARRHHGRQDIGRSQRAHQLNRWLIALDAVRLEFVQEILILLLAKAVHRTENGIVVGCAERHLNAA